MTRKCVYVETDEPYENTGPTLPASVVGDATGVPGPAGPAGPPGPPGPAGPPGSGAGGLTWLNALDFGPVGTPAQDTTAIQAAINACVSGNRRGGTVYLPARVWQINQTLVCPDPHGGFQDSISLVGDGPSLTKLEWLGPATGFQPMLHYLGQNEARIEGLSLRNATGSRAETVGLWFTGDANTGGTTGGSVILRRAGFSGFSRGVILGDELNAVSELVFELCSFRDCDFGLLARNFNTLDVTLVSPLINHCGVGLDVVAAGSFHVYGGASSFNDVDFHFSTGGGFTVSGFRSEVARRFLVNESGAVTVQGCTLMAPTADKVSIENREYLTIVGSQVDGKIQTAPRSAVTVMGSYLGNGGEPGRATLLHRLPPEPDLRGVSLCAFGNAGSPAINGGMLWPNQMVSFDRLNVDHGLRQDAITPLPYDDVTDASGALIVQPQAAHPSVATLGAGAGFYVKDGQFVIPYVRAGVRHYLSIPLDGATTSWSQTAALPQEAVK